MEITGVSVNTSIGCVQDGLRMCFNGVDTWAQNPDTVGELVFTATGTTGNSTLDASLEWEFPAINGTVITSVPNPPVGPTVVFSLTGLPMNNSDFGKKILKLKHPNIANYAEKEIQLYYKANAWNWPGIQPVPHPKNPNVIHICLNERNYFHYYKETPAYVTGINWYYDGSSCDPLGGPPYTPYVGGKLLIGGPPEYTDVRSGISVANSGDVLRGVNLFAWACRHEYKHHIDYNNWWPIMWILDYDQEEDYLRDAMEYLFHISEGGPYYTNNPYTHPLDVIGGKDDQAECLFTQSTWQDAESGKSYDWAYPGSQWH